MLAADRRSGSPTRCLALAQGTGGAARLFSRPPGENSSFPIVPAAATTGRPVFGDALSKRPPARGFLRFEHRARRRQPVVGTPGPRARARPEGLYLLAGGSPTMGFHSALYSQGLR